jgi:hypothetical protein
MLKHPIDVTFNSRSRANESSNFSTKQHYMSSRNLSVCELPSMKSMNIDQRKREQVKVALENHVTPTNHESFL